MRLHLLQNEFSQFEHAIKHEWLVTNSIGSFASSTVCDPNTHRYHGLLTATFPPPVARTLPVATLDATVRYDAIRPLFSHEYTDGTVDLHNFLQLEFFCLDHGMPDQRHHLILFDLTKEQHP